ncbi:MAG: ribonuclease P protein component [Chloroflexi bacterium]|nr:MAG: ribonuclease P protein component [Chloroflexota bacterium]
MLPQCHRLRRATDLERVRQLGRSWRHPLAILLVQANAEEVSRFAFVASRRVGKATSRNRAKRLLREVVRRHLDEIEAGWDVVLIAREQTAAVSYAEVETAVLALLSRAGLYRSPQATSRTNDVASGV